MRRALILTAVGLGLAVVAVGVSGLADQESAWYDDGDGYYYELTEGWFRSSMAVSLNHQSVAEYPVDRIETERGTRYDPKSGANDGTFFLVDWKGHLQHWDRRGLERSAPRYTQSAR